MTYDFTPEEIELATRLFRLQPESPWSAFCELRGLFGDMPLEKRQALYDIIRERLDPGD